MLTVFGPNWAYAKNVLTPSLVTVESPTFDYEFQVRGSEYNNLGLTSNIDLIGNSSLQMNLANNQNFIIHFQAPSQAALFKRGMEEIPTRYKIIIPANWPVRDQLVVEAKDVKLQDLDSGKTIFLENDNGLGDLVSRYEKRKDELLDGDYNKTVADMFQKVMDKQEGLGVISSARNNSSVASQKNLQENSGELKKTDDALVEAGHF